MIRKGVDTDWSTVSLWKMKVFLCRKVKITSINSVTIRFVSMIKSPSSLKTEIIFSLILSRFEPSALFIAASLSSLYKPTLLLSIAALNRFYL